MHNFQFRLFRHNCSIQSNDNVFRIRAIAMIRLRCKSASYHVLFCFPAQLCVHQRAIGTQIELHRATPHNDIRGTTNKICSLFDGAAHAPMFPPNTCGHPTIHLLRAVSHSIYQSNRHKYTPLPSARASPDAFSPPPPPLFRNQLCVENMYELQTHPHFASHPTQITHSRLPTHTHTHTPINYPVFQRTFTSVTSSHRTTNTLLPHAGFDFPQFMRHNDNVRMDWFRMR